MSNKHSYNHGASVTMRRANIRDDAALERLAQLEGRAIPAEPVLVAEVDGRVLAAVSIADGEAIADPFAPTRHLVEMLRAHAHPLTAPVGRRFGLGRGFTRRAPWPA